MSADCRWIASKLEDLLLNDPELRQRAELHVRGCAPCRAELEAHDKLDRLLAAYVNQQAGRTAAPLRHAFPPLRAVAAGVGLAVALLAVWAAGSERGLWRDEPAGLSRVAEEPIVKAGERPDALRAKPDPAPAGTAASQPPADTEHAAEEFYVADAAGYFYSLSDFSDTVLVLGVFDGSGRGVGGFERLSQAYRSQPSVRFLAVGLDREPQLPGASLPVMTNRGSRLMDTEAGDFSIIGKDGVVHRRGSLDDDALDQVVSESLEALGVGN